MRNAGHTLAHLVELARRIACFQQRISLGVITDANIEGLGHRIGGDVVMGGPDAAGGKDKVIAGAQGIQGRDDLVFHIGHHPRLAQVDAQRGQEPGDIAGVGVLGAARQDFVADHQNGGLDCQFMRL